MQRTLSSLRRIDALDTALALRCNRVIRHRALRDFFRAASRLGDGVFWYALMAALPLIHGARAWPAVAQMAAAGVIGVAAYRWLKTRTLRPRPFQAHPDIVAACAPLDHFSFPSGHTLHAVSFSLIASHHFPELAPGLFGFAALVAASRPILGLHYPSDVLAGAGIGAVLATALLAL
ncbi:MAG: phosphatase PAP2 family protein [Betaproteobacteria bacterium]|nr:phosphatase PAP2 family protein [Betaproteobacteria bacterium]